MPYKFRFAGRIFRESAKTRSKTLARQAERKRYQSLEEAIHGIKKRAAPVTLATAAADWLKLKKPTLAPKSHQIEQLNIDKHLKQTFGSLLLMDVTADDIAEYQKGRLREGAAPKTINLELGTLRAILRRHRIWANAGTTVLMARRYGHITAEAQRSAVRELNRDPASRAEVTREPSGRAGLQ